MPRTGSSVPPEGVALATNSIAPVCGEAHRPTVNIAKRRKDVALIFIFMMFIVTEWQRCGCEVVVKVNV
jgi:hypothetical protein